MDGVSAEELARLREESAKLSRLRAELSCDICHNVLCAPVMLPCEHLFCSWCVRVHLRMASKCPQPYCGRSVTTTDIVPIRRMDAAASVLKGAVGGVGRTRARAKDAEGLRRGPMTYLTINNGAKPVFTRELTQLGLSVSGTLEVLARRYNEFVSRWNANLDAASPLPEAAVAKGVREWETKVETGKKAAARVMAGKSGEGAIFSFLHVGAGAKRKPQTQNVETHIPEIGDNHSTLIRKAKLGIERAKKNIGGVARQAPKRLRHGLVPEGFGADAPRSCEVGSEEEEIVLAGTPSAPPSPVLSPPPSQRPRYSQSPSSRGHKSQEQVEVILLDVSDDDDNGDVDVAGPECSLPSASAVDSASIVLPRTASPSPHISRTIVESGDKHDAVLYFTPPQLPQSDSIAGTSRTDKNPPTTRSNVCDEPNASAGPQTEAHAMSNVLDETRPVDLTTGDRTSSKRKFPNTWSAEQRLLVERNRRRAEERKRAFNLRRQSMRQPDLG